MLQFLKIKNQRYSFWRVLWTIVALNVILSLIAVGAIVTTSVLGQGYDWLKYLSFNYIIKKTAGILASAIFFYYTLNYFNWLITERKKALNYFPPIAIAVLVMFFYQFVSYYTFDVKVEKQLPKELTTGILIFAFAMSAIFTTGISLLIAWLNSLKDANKQRKVLEQQKMELEVEKSQANLNFLKAQINPHFLHNTLNFLYAKALPLSNELSEGIATLSDIMRYALSDGKTQNGKSLLKEEIEHVQNVIKINQLRFSNNLKVEFVVEGVINGKRIIPFVLITLVENAFKHGDLKSNEHPIDIKIEVDNNKLLFYCLNRKKTGPKELSTGLGLDNIKKRLDLAYGNNYSFIVKDEIDFYSTELTINAL